METNDGDDTPQYLPMEIQCKILDATDVSCVFELANVCKAWWQHLGQCTKTKHSAIERFARHRVGVRMSKIVALQKDRYLDGNTYRDRMKQPGEHKLYLTYRKAKADKLLFELRESIVKFIRRYQPLCRTCKKLCVGCNFDCGTITFTHKTQMCKNVTLKYDWDFALDARRFDQTISGPKYCRDCDVETVFDPSKYMQDIAGCLEEILANAV